MMNKYFSFLVITRITFIWILLLFTLCECFAQTNLEWQFSESKLAQMNGRILGWTISLDMNRVAFVVQNGKKSRAVIDGIGQPEFDKILGLQFSPDSKRTAYVATNANETFIVVDGKAIPPTEIIGKPTKVWFTPDSKRVDYQSGPGGWVIDGKSFSYVRGPVYSRDGSRFAFCGDERVNIDGVERNVNGVVVGSQIVFSPDSKHVAFLTIRSEGVFLDLDGKESPVAGGIQAEAYPHKTGKSIILWDVLDWGRPMIAFSPDSKRLAYWGYVEKDKLVMVEAGKAGLPHRGIGAPVFSSDSQHLAYAAWDYGKWKFGDSLLVIDGVEQVLSKYVLASTMVLSLSSDGKRTAYFAEATKNAVIDGVLKENYKFDYITPPVFSPSGRHVVYLGGTYPGLHLKWRLFVDESLFGGFFDNALSPVFDSDDQFRYIQVRTIDKNTTEIWKITGTKKKG